MLDRSMKGILKIKTYLGNSKLAKVVVCELCRVPIYEISDKPTQSEVNSETKRVVLHLKLMHDLDVNLVSCSNPNCAGGH